MSTEGTTAYDRDFLLKLEHASDSVLKPADLPDMSEIFEESPRSQSTDKAEGTGDIYTAPSQGEDKSTRPNSGSRVRKKKTKSEKKLSEGNTTDETRKTTVANKRPGSGKDRKTEKLEEKFNKQSVSVKEAMDVDKSTSAQSCNSETADSQKKSTSRKSHDIVDSQSGAFKKELENASGEKFPDNRKKNDRREKEQKCGRPQSGKDRASGKSYDVDQRNLRQRGQPARNQQNTDRNRQDVESMGKSPRGQGQGRGKNQRAKTPATPKQIFEPYCSLEELSSGLKRGQLIQGPIRINPKNYEECYIPHPDGVSDIFISGMKDRNRAMNGDIVAVLIHGREQWRVDVENLGCYEADVAKTLDSKTKENSDKVVQCKEIPKEAEFKQEVEFVKAKGKSDEKCEVQDIDFAEDSDPDVVVESEEEIDLITGQSIKLSDKSINKDLNSMSSVIGSNNGVVKNCTNGNVSITGIVDGISNISIASCDNDSSQAKTDVSTAQIERSQVPKSSVSHSDVKSAKMESNNPSQRRNRGQNTPNEKNRRQNTPNEKNKLSEKGNNSAKRTPQKKYTALQDVLQDGSPVAKNLFASEKKEDSHTKGSSDKYLQRTAKVVAIVEPKHSRACTGNIKLMQDKNPNKALFVPMDARVPRIIIPMSDCPPNFMERPEDHANTLFIARITDWPESSMMAHGELKRSLGEAGEIEPETEGILIENDVDFAEFTEEVLSSLPVKVLPWVIPEEEFTYRRDFRKECIFTIDPTTARDLDDALSCEHLEDGTYEVGVHIADVSHFLKEGTALDRVAGSRCTSVYLVQKVIPMLPRILCEQLCSLNPNEDRLTFSVVWKMSESGEIYEEWFGRSVINSCVKLSYDHAQGFIEQPHKDWTTEELPPIDRFSVDDIKKRVLNLNKIAVCLRKLRFDSGALRLDQVKLQYTLDPATGLPNGYNVYQQRDSNRLVEEFMLLANMAVAHKIKSTYPSKALLRRHPPPQNKMADELSALCDSLGVPIDISSAGTLQKTIWRYCGDDEYSTARMQVLVAMCSRPMQNAKYFCTGSIEDEELYHHYALNVPLYTHFTSPIRRYADVIVHRLLAASLGYCEEPTKSVTDIQKQSEQCNDKKTNSKRVQDLSLELYFAVFVKAAGPFEEKAMVMGVLDKSFDVFVLKLGVVKRVYCDKLEIKDKMYVKEQKKPVLTLIWAATEKYQKEVHQSITIFTIVDCVIQAGDRPLAWMATIKHPNDKDV